MQQDINVARCAHVALWEIIRYFSQRQPCYKEVTMGELIHMADSSMRRVPSNGMTIDQMAQVLSKVGFSVELWNRKAIEKVLERAVDNIKIHELVYTYIESGLPVIAVYRSKPHAICIMGHGGMLPKSEFRDKKGIISSSLLHRNFITCDDNKMPYSIQGSKDLEDIDFLISSLHSKMYVRVYDFLNNFLSEFEQKMVTSRLEANTQYIRRVLITSGKSLKKFILQHSDDEKYRDYMGRLQMPKFVIMVEYGALDSYPESINFRAVFDSTALQSLDADAILIAFKAKKALLVPGIKDPIPLNAEEEPLYKNNLKEVVL